MLVTIFKNIYALSEPFHTEAATILGRIKNGNSRELCDLIKNEWEKEKASNLKKKLPSICFSGKFSERDDNKLLEHSGLICLDIDALQTEDLDDVRGILENDKFVHACFISPGGKGFKLLVQILPDQETHISQFLALEKYFNDKLKGFTSTIENKRKLRDGTEKKKDESQGEFLRVCIDPSGKNVSRVCYESYDPQTYYNPDSELFTEENKEEKLEFSSASEMDIIDGLYIWIEKNDSYYEGNRNQYIYKFAAALCNYGVVQTSAEGFILSNYDLPENEIKATVRSAYKSNEFGIKTFEKGKSGKDKIVLPAPIVKDKNVTSFWHVNDKGKATIDPIKFLPFLEANGFFTYRTPGDVKGLEYVQVKNMIVEIVGQKDIKTVALDYVKKHAPIPVQNELMLKARYFENSFLNGLKEIIVNQVRDGSNYSYAFFDGFYYEIKKDSTEKKNYIDLKGAHIWKSQLCKKNITEIDKDFERHDFPQFIFRAMGKDPEKYKAIKTSIGYLMHNYKDESLTKLVYLSDESIGETYGEANGGTGKNLALKSLELVRNVVSIDGKDFDKRDRFKFQSVKDDTQLVLFDDYEGTTAELFTKVTGNFSTQRKGKDEVQLEFEVSPKIAISSNKSPAESSASYMRRTNSVEFSNHYNEHNTPSMEFKRSFFGQQWTQKDYNAVYTFLFHCVRLYLSEGIIEVESENIHEKRLIRATSPAFTEWFYENELNLELHKEFLIRQHYNKFTSETSEEIRHQEFNNYYKKLAKIFNWNFRKVNARKGADAIYTFDKK